MDHPPRFDIAKDDPFSLKPKLAHYANNFLQKLWVESSHKENIMVGSHNLDCSVVARRERFTDDRTGKYDGIHMYGSSGKLAYTDSLVNILLSSLETSQLVTEEYSVIYKNCQKLFSSFVGLLNKGDCEP